MAKRVAVFLTKLWEKTKPVPGDSTDVFLEQTTQNVCQAWCTLKRLSGI